jgi:osmotically inducible lipoprotein OsmB
VARYQCLQIDTNRNADRRSNRRWHKSVFTEGGMYRAAIIAFAVSASLLGGCASRAQLVGTGIGAAAGAAVGGGALSTMAGGVIGYQAGKRYDERHNR